MGQTNVKPRHTLPEKLHLGFLILCIVLFPVTLLWLVQAAGITLPLLPVMAILHRMPFRHRDKGKEAVRRLRVTAFAATLLYALIPACLFCFDGSRAMYPVKRFVYQYGVGRYKICSQLLPDFMPKVCENYRLVTMPAFGGLQDYYPALYLVYYTDPETLQKYAAYMQSLEIAEKAEIDPPDADRLAAVQNDAEQLWLAKRPKVLPGRLYGMIDRDEDLSHAEIYVIHDYYSKGCLLNFETGLAAFWI